jgi:hypothetical protein
MEPAPVSRKSRGVADRAGRFLHDGAPRAEKNALKPHQSVYWKIPPDHSASFAAPMEDVLGEYEKPYNADCPLVCMDESNKQLVGEARAPIAAAPGHPQIVDHEYVRHGAANIFLEVEPLAGKSHVEITETRTRRDWAWFIKGMVDERYPQAKKIRLVMDNLNTHDISSLYATFAPEEAKRLADKLEIYYTPRHGSWLNIAEIELSVLSRQCLDRRIPTIEQMRSEVNAWQADRNNRSAKVDWQFANEKARVKLKRLYPKL